MHYVLHHVLQPYENRLPEWVANTTTENARWLIENVMPFESPAISPTLDTDGDGIPDLQEAIDQTFPFSAPEPLFDDFSTYANGDISGQTGSPTGFEAAAWQSSGAQTPTTVSGGVVTSTGNGFRTHRALSPSISTGTVYLRANLVLGTAPGSFQALEFSLVENNGDTNAVRLVGGSNLSVSVTGGGTSATIRPNDGLSHQWLIELNLDTRAGRAWIDGNVSDFDPTAGGTAFTAAPGFAINAINIATFAASGQTPMVALDDIRIGKSWSSIGVTVNADTFASWIGGFVLDPTKQGIDDDPDNDGIKNGIENFFGTAPNVFSRGLSAETHDPATGLFTLTHPQGNLSSDLTASYQWSKDLVNFHSAGSNDGTSVLFSTSTNAGITTVTATAAGAIPETLFIRVIVTQN